MRARPSSARAKSWSPWQSLAHTTTYSTCEIARAAPGKPANPSDIRGVAEMHLENVEDVYRLSPMQQGLLFHSLYTPNLDVYFQQFSCRVRGEFDVAAFTRAWQRSVDRHAILRTAFFWDGLDEALQVVRQQVSLPCAQLDWRMLPADEQEDRLAAYLRADLKKGFDFTEA